jgi:putative transposase
VSGEELFPRRRSVRLTGHDYSEPGAYFLTICTHHRRSLFGSVQGPRVKLSPIGRIADACWLEIPVHFPNVGLRIHVIMPNHIHGILVIQTRLTRPDVQERDGTHSQRLGAHPPGSIPAIVRSFKAIVARRVRESGIGMAPLWQRGYYEHIIRTEEEFRKTWEYIRLNPARWHLDKENPAARKVLPDGRLAP